MHQFEDEKDADGYDDQPKNAADLTSPENIKQ